MLFERCGIANSNMREAQCSFSVHFQNQVIWDKRICFALFFNILYFQRKWFLIEDFLMIFYVWSPLVMSFKVINKCLYSLWTDWNSKNWKDYKSVETSLSWHLVTSTFLLWMFRWDVIQHLLCYVVSSISVREIFPQCLCNSALLVSNWWLC